MKKTRNPRVTPKKPSLILRLFNPCYICFSGKHAPKINQEIKRIIAHSS